MYQHILVPLDGSATAERGLREALRLAAVIRTSPVPVLLVRCEPEQS